MKLCVLGSTAARGEVLETVERVCREFAESTKHEDASFIHEMVSAVGEAFNNIAIHAYNDTNRKDVLVELSFDHRTVTATLKDFGKAFKPKPHVELDFAKVGVVELPESGMGMFIMRAFVDEVVYTPGNPNVLKLRKRVA